MREFKELLLSRFERMLDGIDENLPLENVETFEDFIQLSKSRNASVLEVLMRLSRRERNSFSASLSLASLRGDQADKVVYVERYLGQFDREMVEPRLYLTAFRRLQELEGRLSIRRTNLKMSVSSGRGLPETYSMARKDLLMEADWSIYKRFGPLVIDPAPATSLAS